MMPEPSLAVHIIRTNNPKIFDSELYAKTLSRACTTYFAPIRIRWITEQHDEE